MYLEKRGKTRWQILAWAAAVLLPLAALLALARLARAVKGGSRVAPADTFVVTSTADPGDGVCDATCTLREAIDAANETDGPNRITFDLPDGSFITLNGTRLPTIEDTLTIDGSQTADLWVSGNSQSQVFQVRFTAVVTFAGLNIGGGNISTTGAGIYNNGGTVFIHDTLLSGNNAGFGGAVYNRDGELTVRDSTISGNSADATGGGIGSVKGTGEATLTIINSEVTGNLAQRGGGLYLANSANIVGTTFDGNDASEDGGAIYVSVGQLEIGASSFIVNSAAQMGGALYVEQGTASVSTTSFTRNDASDNGGAIFNFDDARSTVTESTFRDNEAANQGGAIFNGGDQTVARSTFIGNSAGVDEGGGISNWGTLEVVNSTFTNNTAGKGGGGLQNFRTASVTNSTFSGNQGSPTGGLANWDRLFLDNTIIANSVTGADCSNTGSIDINDGNLVEDGTCNPAISGDPMLGPLEDNGGSTLTHRLLPGSPAIDAGDQSACQPVDQRGAERPLDGDGDGEAVCDIGALEMDVPIQGLVATNDGPTPLGEATTLTALVQAGSNVTYSWAFGDGDAGSGSEVTHIYAGPGTYTATVTAANAIGSATATTTVSVQWTLYLPLLRR